MVYETINGLELLRMVKNNKFEDGDEIIAEVTIDQVYVYSAYHKNFISKNRKKELTVQEYIFWTFQIQIEEEIDIEGLLEMQNPENWTACDKDIVNIVKNQNRLLKAIKQLNRKEKNGNIKS